MAEHQGNVYYPQIEAQVVHLTPEEELQKALKQQEFAHANQRDVDLGDVRAEDDLLKEFMEVMTEAYGSSEYAKAILAENSRHLQG